MQKFPYGYKLRAIGEIKRGAGAADCTSLPMRSFTFSA
jgi:hypothetical protein